MVKRKHPPSPVRARSDSERAVGLIFIVLFAVTTALADLRARGIRVGDLGSVAAVMINDSSQSAAQRQQPIRCTRDASPN